MQDFLIIKGAREHNLKNVNLKLPRNKFIVFTGLSGSGKSSLAFDTIYSEGQRRYVESLSAYARQFLGQMDKPDVDSISGLSPTISIDQKGASHNPRSTVGTTTEIYDYLRVLYARAGEQFCPNCNLALKSQSLEDIKEQIGALKEGTKFYIMAPLIKGRKGQYESLLADLLKRGFIRVKLDGEVINLQDTLREQSSSRLKKSSLDLKRYEAHDISVVIDRSIARPDQKDRIRESVETALQLGEGVMEVEILDSDNRTKEILKFSRFLACRKCGYSADELSPRNFSFNSPYGACQKCNGLGDSFEVDPELVVKSPELSLNEGAITPFYSMRNNYHIKLLAAFCRAEAIDMDVPFAKLPKSAQKKILYGSREKVSFQFVNRFGRKRTWTTQYEGVINWIQRRYEEAETDALRETFKSYMRETPCSSCNGSRLKPESLSVYISGKSIGDFTALSVAEALGWIAALEIDAAKLPIVKPLITEITQRLRFLSDVGLGYLSLNRKTATLSGGEAQRIRLASQIGSGLVGVLYVLDEPSIGLHPKDNKKLIATLRALKDLGNSVIVVEHDEETMLAADILVDIGPGAGQNGGKVVAVGTPQQVMKTPGSITGKYLSGKLKIEVPEKRRKPYKGHIVIKGAREHNLKNIDVEIPLGLFVAVTGVSGSGKSTLVNDILVAGLRQKIYRSKISSGKFNTIVGWEKLDKLIEIDQSPIGRTPRSNPATYIKLFDNIRQLFSDTLESKIRGYKPGRFSFNVSGGRCETCSGDGYIKIEMHFLPDVYIKCDACKAKRYNPDTLEIKYKGFSIADVLDMTVAEALDLFDSHPVITRQLRTLYDVGLGYIKLGQSAPSLSGGEAQRVKLAAELSKRSTGNTLYTFDEPTTGLHFDDVKKLLEVLERLVSAGNTIVVIEHNLDVIKCADYIIDLGPDGGDAGGQIIACGTPEEVAKNKVGYTGDFLKKII
jgi:excinuclease ABC subunit A